jgi:hypothetical protein
MLIVLFLEKSRYFSVDGIQATYQILGTQMGLALECASQRDALGGRRAHVGASHHVVFCSARPVPSVTLDAENFRGCRPAALADNGFPRACRCLYECGYKARRCSVRTVTVPVVPFVEIWFEWWARQDSNLRPRDYEFWNIAHNLFETTSYSKTLQSNIALYKQQFMGLCALLPNIVDVPLLYLKNKCNAGTEY